MEIKAKRKGSFVVHLEWWPAIKQLSDDDVGKLFRAIMEYQIDGVVPEDLSPELAMAFSFFRARFNVDHERYMEICRKNKEIADRRHGNK